MPQPVYPSIFNDVIGPVMRGASSSHCAASVRIGRLARDLMDGAITDVLIQFDPKGSLATTHASQGSDMGLFGGLLGWETTDERLIESATALAKAGVRATFEITDYGATHPNTYKLSLRNAGERHEMVAISTGGGMIEIVEIDGTPISILGDACEILVYVDGDVTRTVRYLEETVIADAVMVHPSYGGHLIQLKARGFPTDGTLEALAERSNVRQIKRLSPVLPILACTNAQLPFTSCEEMLAYAERNALEIWELGVHYEAARGALSHGEIARMMKDIVSIVRESIQHGIQGTVYADRILGHQSGRFAERMAQGSLLDSGVLNRAILYTTALMEVKSSMGIIVAAPTAGACGGLPGACLGAVDAMGLSEEAAARGMLAAGVIGVLIATRSTFAAEVCGCQAECGAGSGMAAAALVCLAGGTVYQAVAAASMALQNVLGMICDPVASRVEVPCLGRNVLAASNALACANMALAGFDAVVPLDEVIETMDRVGRSLPSELRCTALGGLSITRTSKAIQQRLRQAGKE